MDVIPADPAEVLAADYLAQVDDIAPPKLLGREAELAKLTGFCAGMELYQGWQGDAWVGKIALASWFVLHPPVGVTVASFFISSRLAGQADSTAFTEALIEQLALVAGEPATPGPPRRPATVSGQRRRLLKVAAQRVRDRGGRLLLVVDGLDEDQGVPPAGPSSIASLLPARPPEGVRVLVTSRPHPGLPPDLPSGHPLRTCTVEPLSRSAQAQHVLLANNELIHPCRATIS